MLIIVVSPLPARASKDPLPIREAAAEVLFKNRTDAPLTITLQPGESLGRILVLKADEYRVRLGIEFPKEIAVRRGKSKK